MMSCTIDRLARGGLYKTNPNACTSCLSEASYLRLVITDRRFLSTFSCESQCTSNALVNFSLGSLGTSLRLAVL